MNKQIGIAGLNEMQNSGNQAGTAKTVQAVAAFSVAVFAILAALFGYLNYSQDPELNVLQNANLGIEISLTAALFLSLAALWLARTGRSQIATWLLIITFLAVGVTPSFFFANAGIVVAFTAFEVCVFAFINLIPRRQIGTLMGLGLVSMAGAYLINILDTSSRPPMMATEWTNLVAVLQAIVMVGYIIIRYRTFPFRTKVVTSFLVIGILSVSSVAIVVINTATQSTLELGKLALHNAAVTTAAAVDTFVDRSLERIQVEAQNSAFEQFLGLNPADQTAAAPEIQAALSQLKDQRSSDLLHAGLEGKLIQAYFLVNAEGIIVAANDPAELGQDVSKWDYYSEALARSTPFNSPIYLSGSAPQLYFSSQVGRKQALGVLVAQYDALVFQGILMQNNNLVGSQSYPSLMNKIGVLYATGKAQAALFQSAQSESADVLRNSSLADTADLHAYPWSVNYTQSQNFFLQSINMMLKTIQVAALLVTTAAAGIAILISYSLTRPISQLNQAALIAAQGDLTVRAPVSGDDELGNLSRSFNLMAERLQQTQNELERRVEDRTREVERRSKQFQSAAEIGRTAALIRDVDLLLAQMASLISERFGFYHVGIFLIDEGGQYAVLKAVSSTGGQRMLARGHKLAVGQQGIVGFVTSTGRPRIALDVGSDSAYFNNPDLPETRSEMALPLLRAEFNARQEQSGGQVIGALDIQSEHPNAFTIEDIAVMQVMADLLAVAIDNARLFVESQNSLESLRRAYGDVSRRSWIERKKRIGALAEGGAQAVVSGYRSLERGTVPLLRSDGSGFPGEVVSELPEAEHLHSITTNNGYKLSIPIKVRDEVVGYVDTVKPASSGAWSDEEQDAINTLIDQLGVALESARLYETSQVQAEKERLVAELTAKLQESLDVDAVLRTAVGEIRQTLGLRDVTIILDEAIKS